MIYREFGLVIVWVRSQVGSKKERWEEAEFRSLHARLHLAAGILLLLDTWLFDYSGCHL